MPGPVKHCVEILLDIKRLLEDQVRLQEQTLRQLHEINGELRYPPTPPASQTIPLRRQA
jgi:hypothetical protein